MVTCEMCGESSNSLFTVKVAGSTMKVCRNCKNMGSMVNEGPEAYTFKRKKKENISEEVVSNYQSEISKGMNKKKIDVHQLARVINIKESILTNYVKGKIKPALTDAKKIEKFLEISLVEESSGNSSSEDYMSNDLATSGSLSLGDLIKKQLDKK